MGRFWGNHPGTRQNRGVGRVRQATPQERLASMQRELAYRVQAYGANHWLTKLSKEAINKTQNSQGGEIR